MKKFFGNFFPEIYFWEFFFQIFFSLEKWKDSDNETLREFLFLVEIFLIVNFSVQILTKNFFWKNWNLKINCFKRISEKTKLILSWKMDLYHRSVQIRISLLKKISETANFSFNFSNTKKQIFQRNMILITPLRSISQ